MKDLSKYYRFILKDLKQGQFFYGYHYAELLWPNSKNRLKKAKIIRALELKGYKPKEVNCIINFHITINKFTEASIEEAEALFKAKGKIWGKEIQEETSKGVITRHWLNQRPQPTYENKDWYHNYPNEYGFLELVARGFVDIGFHFKKNQKGWAVRDAKYSLVYPKVFNTQREAEEFDLYYGLDNQTGAEKLPLNYKIIIYK
jgi:hypothetical protein